MILPTLTSVFDCQKTLQEFKPSKVKKFLNEANKALEVHISTTLAVFCSNIVPNASKYFQSCLPLLHPMNIIFQGQYECLGKYGDTGHLSFCFLFALTFSGGSCFPADFCICSMYGGGGGNSLLDAQTQEPAAANPLL